MSADERDRQATPPSGSKVPDEPGDQGDVPTPWELKEKEKAEGNGDDGASTTWVRGEDGNPEEVDSDDPRADAAVTYEPPEGGQDDDEYQWHTAKRTRSETAETDAVEFIDVVKAFGRNTVLNGLNLGIPEGQISMILGPSGTGKSVCIKHMVGLLYPDEGDVLVHGESVPTCATTTCSRCARSSACCSRTVPCSAR